MEHICPGGMKGLIYQFECQKLTKFVLCHYDLAIFGLFIFRIQVNKIKIHTTKIVRMIKRARNFQISKLQNNYSIAFFF